MKLAGRHLLFAGDPRLDSSKSRDRARMQLDEALEWLTPTSAAALDDFAAARWFVSRCNARGVRVYRYMMHGPHTLGSVLLAAGAEEQIQGAPWLIPSDGDLRATGSPGDLAQRAAERAVERAPIPSVALILLDGDKLPPVDSNAFALLNAARAAHIPTIVLEVRP